MKENAIIACAVVGSVVVTSVTAAQIRLARGEVPAIEDLQFAPFKEQSKGLDLVVYRGLICGVEREVTFNAR
jgi:hypothetical protein